MKGKHKEYKAYSVKCFRLDPRTIELLGQIKKKENISWNRIIYKLIQTYEKQSIK